MNWKNFKTWLDRNIVESEGITVKIKSEKQDKFGDLSPILLTNFCDSLEATLDKNASYHLFPDFVDDKSFKEIFDFQNCYFGKKTNKENINETDYCLLEKLFNDWKLTQKQKNKNTMTEIKNILLIGRTGNGKSTLANVLTGTDNFIESADSTSETKSIKTRVFEIGLENERVKCYLW